MGRILFIWGRDRGEVNHRVMKLSNVAQTGQGQPAGP